MNRFLAAVLSCMLIFSLSSCGDKLSPDKASEETYEAATYTESVTTVSETASKPAETQQEMTSVSETSVTSKYIETYTEVTSQPYGESVSEQKVLMFTLYENEAWGFQRSITILDSEGNYCYISHEDEGGGFLSEESGNPLENENWYQNLADALEYGNYTWEDKNGKTHEFKLPDEKLELVKEYTEKFGDYRGAPIRIYGNMAYDYGMDFLYGVYLDENNVPQYIELCASGDWAYCIDDDGIADLANSINGYFFYTLGFDY